MNTIDMKLAGSLAGLVFVAGGAWWNLHAVSGDVSEIKTVIQEQQNDLTIHVAAESHTGIGKRIERIEAAQQSLSDDMKVLLTNQSAICERTQSRCK